MHSCDDVASAAMFLTSLLTKRGDHHSMIDSFYFIALQAIGWSILIRGVVVCYWLDWPTFARKPFHTQCYIFDDQTIDLSKPRQWFWQLSRNQRQNNWEQAPLVFVIVTSIRCFASHLQDSLKKVFFVGVASHVSNVSDMSNNSGRSSIAGIAVITVHYHTREKWMHGKRGIKKTSKISEKLMVGMLSRLWCGMLGCGCHICDNSWALSCDIMLTSCVTGANVFFWMSPGIQSH